MSIPKAKAALYGLCMMVLGPFATLADDPPVFLVYPKQKQTPAKGVNEPDPVHSAWFGQLLQSRLTPLGVSVDLVYPGAPTTAHADLEGFLLNVLRR